MEHEGMVHALRECWRVLQPGKILVDLRPVHSNPPLEVIGGGETVAAGRIDDEGGAPDDEAAGRAVAEMVGRRYFALESTSSFPFYYYWNTVDELLAYAGEKWRDFACVPAAVARRARQGEAGRGRGTRIRIRRKIQMGVYRCLPAG